MIKRVSLLALLSVALLLGGPSAAAPKRCADIFGPAGNATASDIEQRFVRLGLSKHPAAGYVLSDRDGTRHVDSLPQLYPLILQRMAHGAADAHAQIYMSGFSRQESANLVSTLRLRLGRSRNAVDGYAYMPAAGGAGGGEPPTPQPNGAAAAPDDEDPNNGGGADGGDPNSPWRLPAFRRLSQRYDWSKASVASVATPRPMAMTGYDPGYSFLISIPRSIAAAPSPAFRLHLMFKRSSKRPVQNTVQAEIKSELATPELRQATVDRAARRLMERLQSRFASSRALIEAADITIVEEVAPAAVRSA